MTAIVMNTATGAVTEYDWTFASVSASRAANNTALHTLGGDTDATAAIISELRGGKAGGGKLLSLGPVYLTIRGTGDGTLIVMGRDTSWEYPVIARGSGVSVGRPGFGIRESWLGLGYRNAGGNDFRLDRIEAQIIESKTRRS